jgi:hypothetical protein
MSQAQKYPKNILNLKMSELKNILNTKHPSQEKKNSQASKYPKD